MPYQILLHIIGPYWAPRAQDITTTADTYTGVVWGCQSDIAYERCIIIANYFDVRTYLHTYKKWTHEKMGCWNPHFKLIVARGNSDAWRVESRVALNSDWGSTQSVIVGMNKTILRWYWIRAVCCRIHASNSNPKEWSFLLKVIITSWDHTSILLTLLLGITLHSDNLDKGSSITIKKAP